MSTMTQGAKTASKGTFAIAVGLALALVLGIGMVTSVVAAVPALLAMIAIAVGYGVYRHVQSRSGEELHPRRTGSARLVGGEAAHSHIRDFPRR